MPEVTWWQEERMIDRHAEVRHPEQGVRNVLQLERLGRVDLHTKLMCQAANSIGQQLSQPMTKSVQIELNRKSRFYTRYVVDYGTKNNLSSTVIGF